MGVSLDAAPSPAGDAMTPNRIGLHLSWPPLPEALRDARNRLRDAEWEGRDTTAALSEVRHLEIEQRAGVRYVVPF